MYEPIVFLLKVPLMAGGIFTFEPRPWQRHLPLVISAHQTLLFPSVLRSDLAVSWDHPESGRLHRRTEVGKRKVNASCVARLLLGNRVNAGPMPSNARIGRRQILR